MKKIQSLCLLFALCMLILVVGCSSLNSRQPDSYIDPVTGMEFTLIPGGCFQMGNLWGKGDPNEEPVHRVCLDDYYLAKTEVTQAQWQKVMGENPSYFQNGETLPVETVSWNDANAFLKKLSQNHEQPFRLPTEAEWEYACRSGGREERYCGGDDLKEIAWFDRTGGGTTQPVATRQPNGLGLYDMSGNVWEFCSDTYAKDYYATSPEKNPQGAEEGPHVIKRGGSWSINPRYLRSSVRGRATRHDAHYSTGFRVAISARH
jgi:formylglycine-generating enzyme required for sulfatase activity